MPGASVQSIDPGKPDASPVFGATHSRLRQRAVAIEAAWHNVILRALRPGEKIIVLCNGHFSRQRAEMACGLGLEVEVIESRWGEELPVRALARRLGRDLADEVRAVFVMHAEASTGVLSDIAAVRRALDENFHDALLFVEATAAALRMEEWRADVVIYSARQVGCAPSAFPEIALSDRAAEVIGEQRAAQAIGSTVLGDATRRDARSDRRAIVAAGLRRGIAALGLGVVARSSRIASPFLTVVRLPQTVRARDVISTAWAHFGVVFEDGVGELSGQVVMIAHDNAMDTPGCLAALTALGRALEELGAGVSAEDAVAAARAHFGVAEQSAPGAFHIAAE
jgi:alanine-glyoxylate transaminase / serine-glyoxylate transaminase / serine-pyruvate transaminase